ncbi:dal80p-controlled protein [Tilletia horrida]|nr:dal80p-controlled protein [Tilletia horrida]
MLRHAHPSKPTMHILEAAVLHALPLCTRFGVITTGADAVPDIDRGIRDVLGANSYRYIGTLATGLGVVELQTGDQAKVQSTLQQHAAKLAEMGADAIILGCAGMTGMEAIVRQGAQSALKPGKQVAVIDGCKAGVQLLAGLAACRYFGP